MKMEIDDRSKEEVILEMKKLKNGNSLGLDMIEVTFFKGRRGYG